ncbi:restriction endonuclease subunit S [Streptococcus oralis]|uniref:Restriction modification system DNA specificity domain protein n=1 Tax=Streptococcus oralis TaxID=1303 RepID=A0A4V0E849_STROR|nr:restriction endonuclease subunit S [Streptococcus oralis]VTT04066.1 Restriction modification system DNA specificity domain protein [Streptococcus oralis]
MKNQNKKIPKIRFESFEKRWESYQLSEYSSYRRGSFPQPYGNKEWYGGNNAMPFVQVVDVLENLRLVADTKQKISNLAQPMSVFVPSNSVIVTLQGSIGRVAITQYDAYVDRTILIFEDYISQTNKEFWAYTIRNKFEIERQKAPGGTIKTITKEALSDFKVLIPSYSEQSAIGSLFRTLDDLLASYKDNLSNYQVLKATMLSKMFPKAGQAVPEIRMNGFEGEWEKVKLKDVTESIEYGLNASAKEFDGENKYIRITDIDDVSRKFKEDSITSPDINVSECDNYLLCEKDILFARTGASVGKTYLYDIKDGKVYFAGFLIRARIKEKFDSKFIFQNTLTDRFTQYVKVTSQRSGQPGVNGKEYGGYELYIPKYKEQQAIGAYFSNLDNLINSYQEKISQLETLKKKLLQDMFI